MSVGRTIYEIISHTVLALECLICLLFIPKYKLLDEAGKWLYYYVMASTAGFIISMVLRWAGNNIWVSSLMFLIQFIILTSFYYLITESAFIRQLIRILTFATAAVFLLDFFWWSGFFIFNSNFASVRTGLLIVYGGIFFFQLLSDRRSTVAPLRIQDQPNFWFNAGLFIHHSSFFLLALTYNLYRVFPEKLWLFTYVNVLVFVGGLIEYILIYVGLRKVRSRPVKVMKM